MVRDLVQRLGCVVYHKVGLKESSVLSELVGCMAHETP